MSRAPAMVPFRELDQSSIEAVGPEELNHVDRLLLAVSRCLIFQQSSFKVTFYHNFLLFLEAIALDLIAKNNMVERLRAGVSIAQSDRITTSFFQLLRHYRIAYEDTGYYFLAPKYDELGGADFRILSDLMDSNLAFHKEIPSILKRPIVGYRFVSDLIARSQSVQHPLTRLAFSRAWEQIVDAATIEYELRLADTLRQLRRLKLPYKIASPFDDSHYTESGRSAYNNFTRRRFLDCLNEINLQHRVRRVLDIGCGYGDYINAIATQFADAKILGVELQKAVCDETARRFSGNNNIRLINGSIFDYDTSEKFDIALLNYVLFYFDGEQKERLFHKLYDQLEIQGTILVCQYYAGIEPMKKQIAKKQRQWSVATRIGTYYGDKVLYANALWNEASDAFAQGESWGEFKRIIEKAGFEIESVTHADPYYYSLFVQIKKKSLNVS